ncbi:ATP-NAD kinase [Apiospora phragmitis]|uniref:ATP-NAD kinase n=1 Tax=Apiospora phragmitis TaxID=2905665 RepID=A0ABR1T3X5_9PEZI
MSNSHNPAAPAEPHEGDNLSHSSDDDMRAVEVSFDATSPYRRKSSMAHGDSARPRLNPPLKKTQCLVHQFIENERSGQRLGRNSSPDDLSSEVGLDRVVEPKGQQPGHHHHHHHHKAKKPAFIESDSAETSDAGQADEQSWKVAVTTPHEELDLSAENHEVHSSRLLTKKQLGEMAWGVRELSRRLGSVRLNFEARSIFILTKVFDIDLVPKTREIAKWLLSKERGVRYTVWLQDSLKENKRFDLKGMLEELRQEYIDAGELEPDAPIDAIEKRVRFWNENLCRTRPHTFDLGITLGGDGTVLYASWLFQRIVPPFISFALGSLGFLTKFDFAEHQNTLTTALKDGVTVSLRLRFEGTIMRSQARRTPEGKDQGSTSDSETQQQRDLIEELIGEEKDDDHTHRPDGTYEILNEIVVDRGPNPTMSYTEVFADDEHFTSILADGVCISTPTGSTAYNLAAGGSLCHPENPVMLLTSICAHTLSFRPVILPDTIVLRIGVPYDARTNSWASFDGRERLELFPGDYVTISASRFPFASCMPQGRRSEDWVNSISGKLGWNTRQKQKNDGYQKWDK